MDAFEHCQALVRAGDKDRYLAALFAPAEHRNALFALYACNLEIARIREAVRDPLAGEIRLQWWNDVFGGEGRGGIEGHPVAAALLASIAKYGLPMERFKALLDARRFDLYDEPMQSLAEFESYAEGASANLLALAAQMLNPGCAPNIAVLCRHAGLAHAFAGLLNAFPVHARRGQLYLPLQVLEQHGVGREDVANSRPSVQLRAAFAQFRRMARKHLAQARELLGSAPAAVMPALLPVALTGPMLARMERPGYDPFAPVEIPPWRRQWLIWRAARQPDRIFR